MKKILIKIWTYWCLFITAWVFLFLLPFNLFLIYSFGEKGRVFLMHYSRYVANILIFLFGMQKVVSGNYPMKHKDPCIYIVNHKSYLDVIIVASLISNKLKYLGKEEMFSWPLFGPFVKKSKGMIPVKRDSKESRQKSYNLMKKALQEGYSIILFPEGGWRNNNQDQFNHPYQLKQNVLLQDFRNGAFRLALDAKVPVLPIALLNAQERFTDLKMRVVPGKIKVHVFDLIDSSIYNDSFDLNHKCHNLILSQLKKYNL